MCGGGHLGVRGLPPAYTGVCLLREQLLGLFLLSMASRCLHFFGPHVPQDRALAKAAGALPASCVCPSPQASSPLFLGTAYSTFTFYLRIGLSPHSSKYTAHFFFPSPTPTSCPSLITETTLRVKNLYLYTTLQFSECFCKCDFPQFMVVSVFHP